MVINPLNIPNIKEDIKNSGRRLKILSWGMIHIRAIKNWPSIWPNAAIIPRLMIEKYFFGSFWKINKRIRLEIAPKRLRKKVGAIKEPTNILVTKTLISDTQTAVCKLNFTKVYKIIILAIPGFTPGIGLEEKIQ